MAEAILLRPKTGVIIWHQTKQGTIIKKFPENHHISALFDSAKTWICLRCLEKVTKNILPNGGKQWWFTMVENEKSPTKTNSRKLVIWNDHPTKKEPLHHFHLTALDWASRTGTLPGDSLAREGLQVPGSTSWAFGLGKLWKFLRWFSWCRWHFWGWNFRWPFLGKCVLFLCFAALGILPHPTSEDEQGGV